MEVTIKTPYRITVERTSIKTFDDSGFVEYVKDWIFRCNSDLEEAIYEYFLYTDFILVDEDCDDILEDFIEIDELNELVEKYSYLIKEDNEESIICCSLPRTSNYCPNCGTKLK